MPDTPGLVMAIVLAWVAAPPPDGGTETRREAAARITALIRAEKWEQAQETTEALVHAPDERHAAAVLGLLLRDRTLPGRSHLMTPIARARFTPAVPHLVRLLGDPEPDIRSWAASTLGEIGDKSAVRALERRLKKTDEDQKYPIRVALAQLGKPYLGYFIEGLQDRAPNRRSGCASALKQLKDPRAVPSLLARLDERDDDSKQTVRWALQDTTGIPEATVIRTIVNPDGSTCSALRIRPVTEFRKDVEEWVGQNREAVQRAIEPPVERWAFTPEPELPGLGVSFQMTAADVRRAFDKAEVRYTYHPERLDKQPGANAIFYPEYIDADGQEAFDGVWGFGYTFARGRLEEVHFTADSQDHELAGLVKPLRLRPNGIHSWTGMDGAIRVRSMFGDAEKVNYTIRLNYRNR